MKKILIGNGKFLVLSVVLLLVICCGLLITQVKTNYDMTLYLPEDSNTKKALNILEEEFSNKAIIQIMLVDVSIAEALVAKQKLLNIDGVEKVVWVDDYVDLDNQLFEPGDVSHFYLDNCALMFITLQDDAYSIDTENTITKIEEQFTNIYLRGEVLYNIESRRIAEGEIFKIMFFIIPICVLILFLVSKTWLEPIIILITLAFAIVLNMGTNALLPNVSFITLTLAMALQLALSLDYSLFLIHRFYEERNKGVAVIDSIICATKKTFSSITASALTTIMGFMALLFMSYKIGIDIGIVLSKGILFSYLSVLIIMPILLYFCSPLLKPKKSLIPNFKFIPKYLYRFRFVLVFVFVGIAVFALVFQSKVEFTYGNNPTTDNESQIVIAEREISKKFGIFQPIVLLVENDDISKEIAIVQELMQNQNIISIQSLITIVDSNIPREMVPCEIRCEFQSENYTRFIINTNIIDENEKMYIFNDSLHEIVSKYYDNYYFAGITTSTGDIKETVISDTIIVTLFSIFAIALVIAISFKSYIIPVLLISVIQVSIWLNVSVAFFQEYRIIYIGYLVVLALQLGATIDYAVLLTNRYREFRVENKPLPAMEKAFEYSIGTIIISSLILMSAGVIEGIFSDIDSVKQIGFLIGRGAIFSCLLVIFILPAILLILDRLIYKLK